MRIAWRFYDPQSTEEYFLPVNPSEDTGSFTISKTTKYESAISTYRDNNNELRVDDTVIQDAPNEQQPFAYRGTVYTKNQYDQLILWLDKNYAWQLRDDLGREILVLVDKYSMERVRSAKFRWKHEYNFSGIILEEI